PFITRSQLDNCFAKYPLDATEGESQHIKVVYNKRDSSHWRDMAFGVAEGERNEALASLIGYLLRRYVDAHLVYGLISAWAMTCTPPIEQNEVNKTFNSIYKKHTNNI
ncbi:primase alpha helix C-terminal domain-containing protein, partial [Staphylococcus pseudintermedius]